MNIPKRLIHFKGKFIVQITKRFKRLYFFVVCNVKRKEKNLPVFVFFWNNPICLQVRESMLFKLYYI